MTRLWIAVVLSSTSLLACGNGGGNAPLTDVPLTDQVDQAVVTPDAPRHDGPVPDDGPPGEMTPVGPPVDNTTTGMSCTQMNAATTCGSNSVCLFERDGQVTGVCSATGCTVGPGDNCGSGFQCVQFTGNDTGCLKLCTPMSGGNNCGDPSSVCHPLADYCTGACASDAECGTGNYCHPMYKVCFTDGTTNPDAKIGDPCTMDTDCPRNGVCATDQSGFTGGYCTILKCQFDPTNFACPTGSLCAPSQEGNDFCLEQCSPNGTTTDAGPPPGDMTGTTPPTAMCRTGYDCAPIQGAGGLACIPHT
jgi:hypothetical protein